MGRILFAFLFFISIGLPAYGQSSTRQEDRAEQVFDNAGQTFYNLNTSGVLPLPGDTTDLEQFFNNPDALNGCAGNEDCENLFNQMQDAQDAEFGAAQNLIDQFALTENPMDIIGDAIENALVCVEGSEAETRENTEYFEYRCNSGENVVESESTCNLILVHEVREGYVYECPVTMDENGVVVISGDCQALSGDPSCVLSNSECSVQGGDVTEDVACRIGPASLNGNINCGEKLVHELAVYFSYECEFLWNESTSTWEPDAQCQDHIDDGNCSQGGQSCSDERPPDIENVQCESGDVLSLETGKCEAAVRVAADEDYGWEVGGNWEVDLQKYVPDADSSFYGDLLTRGCAVEDLECVTPAPVIEESLTCQVGFYIEESSESCVIQRVVEVDEDYRYEGRRTWNAGQAKHNGDSAWQTLDASCALLGSHCTTPTPPSYSYYSCEKGYKDTVTPISCNVPREITVDADYRYEGRREWDSGAGLFNNNAALTAATGNSDCTVTRNERCIQDSPGVYETLICDKGYRIDYVTNDVRRDLLVEVDEDYIYTGKETWNGSSFVQDAVLVKAKNSGAATCNFLGKSCTAPSGGVTSEHICKIGYQINYANHNCQTPLAVSIDNDYLHQADRNFSRSLSKWVNTSQLNALKSNNSCVFQSQQCITQSPGVFSTFSCNRGQSQSFSTHTESRYRVLEVDEDYIYKRSRYWNASQGKHVGNAAWTAVNNDGSCVKTGSVCAQTTPPPFNTYTCQSGYKDVTSNVTCVRQRKVEVDVDYIYTVDRQFNTGTNQWTGTGDWNAVRNNNSCVRQSATCDTNSPGVFTNHTCDQGYRIDDSAMSCSKELTFTVETDYRYTGYETWNGSSFVRDATLTNINSQKSSKSCVRESVTNELASSAASRTSTYECIKGTIDYSTEATCETVLNVSVNSNTGYRYRERDAYVGTNGLFSDGQCTFERFQYIQPPCYGWNCNRFGIDTFDERNYWSVFKCTAQKPTHQSRVYLGTYTYYTLTDNWNTSSCNAASSAGALKSEVCIEGSSTKTINGQAVTRSCWKKRRTYGATKRETVNNCVAPSGFSYKSESSYTGSPALGVTRNLKKRVYQKTESLANASKVVKPYVCFTGYWLTSTGARKNYFCSPPSGSTQKSSTCAFKDSGGSCRLYMKTYTTPNPGPAGGYSRHKEVWKCDKAVTGSGVASPSLIRNRKSWVWGPSSCPGKISGYSNGCTYKSAGYVGSSKNKTVDGLTIKRQWTYQYNYTCHQRVNVNTCSPLLAVNDSSKAKVQYAGVTSSKNASETFDERGIPQFNYSDENIKPETALLQSGKGVNDPPIVLASVGDWTYTGQVCANYEGSTCTLWRKTYKREETDPSGGCVDQSEVWRCENSVSNAGTPTYAREIISDKWEWPSADCQAKVAAHGSCAYKSQSYDYSTGGTRVINGMSINKPAWELDRHYSCTDRITTETCSPPSGAVHHNTTCAWPDSGGVCRLANKEYRIYLPDPSGGCARHEDTFRCENRSHGTPQGTTHDVISNSFPAVGANAALWSRPECKRKSYQWEDYATRVVNGYSYTNYWGLSETFECEKLDRVDTCEAFTKDDYVVPGMPGLSGSWVSSVPSSPAVNHPAITVRGSTGNYYADVNLTGYGSSGYISAFERFNVATGDTYEISLDARLVRPTTTGNPDRFLLGFIKQDDAGTYKSVLWAWKYAGSAYGKHSYKFTVPASRDYTTLRPVIMFNYAYTNQSYLLDSRFYFKNLKVTRHDGFSPAPQSKSCIESHRDGSCGVYRYTYLQEEEDPSGGCLKFREEFLCENEVPAAGNPAGIPSEVLGQSWNLSACQTHINNNQCELLEDTCIEGAGTRVIGGVSVYQVCWKKARVYECGTRVNHNTCSQPSTATLANESCLWTDRSGVCRLHKRVYHNQEHDPSGGCHEYSHEYRCEEKLDHVAETATVFDNFGWRSYAADIGTSHTALNDVAEFETYRTFEDAGVGGLRVTAASRRLYVIGDQTLPAAAGDRFRISVKAKEVQTGSRPGRFLMGAAGFDDNGKYVQMLWSWFYTAPDKKEYFKEFTVPSSTSPIVEVRPNIVLNWSSTNYTVGAVYEFEDISAVKLDGGNYGQPSDILRHIVTNRWDYQPYVDMRNEAQPPYDRCVYTGQTTCTQGAGTRNINGLDVYKACWSYDFKYECETKQVIDECNVQSNYSQNSRTCAWTDRNGRCQLYEYNYSVELPDPSGGCHVYATEFICENQLGDNTILETILSVEADTFNQSQCQSAIAGKGTCALVNETCTEGNEQRIIDGLAVTRACWNNRRTYDCTTRESFDTCIIPAGAQSNGVSCLWRDTNDVCRLYQQNYKILLADPSGGCTVYTDSFRCEEKMPSVGTPLETFREVERTYWDESSCDIDGGDRTCSNYEETCSSGSATRNIDGLNVTYACWENTRDYNCTRRVDVNTCEPFEKSDYFQDLSNFGTRSTANWDNTNSAVSDTGISKVPGRDALLVDVTEPREYYVSGNREYAVWGGDVLHYSLVAETVRPSSNNRDRYVFGFTAFDENNRYVGGYGSHRYLGSGASTAASTFTIPENSNIRKVRLNIIFNYSSAAENNNGSYIISDLFFQRTNPKLPLPQDAVRTQNNCLATNQYNQCTLYDRTYTWEVDDGSNGCHRYEAVVWCENNQPIRTADQFRYSYGATSIDTSVCKTFSNDNACVEKSRTCVDDSPKNRVPPVLVTITGDPFNPVGGGPNEVISKDCWNYEIAYECERRTPVEECTEYVSDVNCKLINTTCVANDRVGDCARQNHTYECTIEGTGGCVSQTTEFTCEGQSQSTEGQLSTKYGGPYMQAGGQSAGSTGYEPTSIRAEVVGFHWDKAECSVAPDDSNCQLIETNCIAAGSGAGELPRLAQDEYHQGYISYSEDVVEDCFEKEKVYECAVASNLPACDSSVESCSLTSDNCLFHNADGSCALKEANYSCTAETCDASRAVCDARKGNSYYVGHKYTCNSQITEVPHQVYDEDSTCGELVGSCRRVTLSTVGNRVWIDGPNHYRTSTTVNYAFYCDEQINTAQAQYVGYVSGEGGDASHSTCSEIDALGTCSLISQVCVTGDMEISVFDGPQSGTIIDECQGIVRKVYNCDESAGTGNACSGQCTQWDDQYICGDPQDGITLIDEEEAIVVASVDAGQCADFEDNTSCEFLSERCTQGPETRLAEGVPVFAECWKWERDYRCNESQGFASDCEVPENCQHSHDECLAEAEDGTCLTVEHVYNCADTTEYVVHPAVAGTCEDDASTEDDRSTSGFSEAVAGLMAMEEGGEDFGEDNVSIFKGDDLKCSKWVFGAKNCCKKSGALLFLGCNESEEKLQIARNDNRCISVGSYCSKKAFFGTCLKKKETFCCYKSEISKLVAEAGKQQLSKDFGTPKEPNCSGFSVTEFQRLDLSQVDFSSVAASIIDDMNLGDPSTIQDNLTNRIQQMQGGGG